MMAEVWAHTPYVTNVGPRSTSIIVGWDGVSAYWQGTNDVFSAINSSLSEAHIHGNGDLAWEMGQETGDLTLKDGTERNIDYLVTNVFENIDGHWLMVSHHVQLKPQ